MSVSVSKPSPLSALQLSPSHSLSLSLLPFSLTQNLAHSAPLPQSPCCIPRKHGSSSDIHHAVSFVLCLRTGRIAPGSLPVPWFKPGVIVFCNEASRGGFSSSGCCCTAVFVNKKKKRAVNLAEANGGDVQDSREYVDVRVCCVIHVISDPLCNKCHFRKPRLYVVLLCNTETLPFDLLSFPKTCTGEPDCGSTIHLRPAVEINQLRLIIINFY